MTEQPSTAPASRTTPSTPPLRALLIGIDHYACDGLPPLQGCVNDVLAVERYLLHILGVPPERITKLLAPGEGSEEVAPDAAWPSYEAMVEAIRGLAEDTARGTPVYIHYSGHGSRVPTLTPKLKGDDGLDECLVPPEGGTEGSRYLRDTEMGKLLGELTDAGLIVTLVLDSCHSAGAIRSGAGAVPRGVDDIRTPASTESLVASPEELTRFFQGRRERQGSASGSTRSLSSPGAGWSDTGGYTFLAACRQHERAWEKTLDDGRAGGVLTHWLLETLREGGSDLTYRRLYSRLLARVHGAAAHQTPMIEGTLDRLVLGLDHVPSLGGVEVREHDAASGRLALSVGMAHGVRRDAVLERTEDGKRHGGELALSAGDEPPRVEIRTVEVARSWAEPLDEASLDHFPPGTQLHLVDPGSDVLRRTVRVLTDDATGEARSVLQRIERRVAEGSSGFLLPAIEDEPVDLLVGTTTGAPGDPLLTVLEAPGSPLGGLQPDVASISASDPRAESHLMELLDHLARYENVRRLENPSHTSQVARGLEVELALLPEDFEDGDPLDQVEPWDGRPLRVGEWVRLRIHNGSPYQLHLAVLDLCPDWSISQVLPPPHRAPFFHLEPGGRPFEEALEAGLPDDYPGERGVDLLKVIAATQAFDCRSLEQPVPGRARSTRKRSAKQPTNRLDQLLASVGTSPKHMTRMFTAAGAGFAPWGTAEVRVEVERRARTR